ncbi:MAG: radical SAM protein, partial [Paracoccaceae bacterium]
MANRLSRSGFLPDRTVHLHPLDRCNLACSHCYSTSAPHRDAMLPLGDILAALPHLASEGYEVISLSGGEPLLYPGLPPLVTAAKAMGFRVVAMSNGYRVTAAQARLFEGLDGIGISFDGMEATHLAMRHHPRAWSAAVGALVHLRDIGKPAAAAFTVSRRSLSEVPAFVEMCAGLGVKAVQLRPLVMAGRATSDARDLALTRE